jgi:hypothetical protein
MGAICLVLLHTAAGEPVTVNAPLVAAVRAVGGMGGAGSWVYLGTSQATLEIRESHDEVMRKVSECAAHPAAVGADGGTPPIPPR